MPVSKKKVTKKKTKKKTTKKVTRARVKELIDGEDRPDTAWPWPLRDRQQRAWDALQAGKDKQMLAWHRRYGKDVYCLSVARNQMQKRVGAYVHFLPKTIQARRALWNGVDSTTGKRFLDTAFGDMTVKINNQEMFIEMYNGSTWQLLGSDNYDRYVGSSCVGVSYSEWALCDPRARDFVKPIILQSAKTGPTYEIYISTFRGRNHMWQMFQNLKNNPEWYCDLAGVDVTTELDGSPVMSPEDIDKERRDGMSEALIQQEYYCNPQATADGAIYGNQVDVLRLNEDRQKAFWDPSRPVLCAWNFDLPVFGAYVIYQPAMQAFERPLILDCGIREFEELGTVLAEVSKRPYPIQKHVTHNDNHDMVSNFQSLGLFVEVINMPSPYYITERTQHFLNLCAVSPESSELLLDALAGYKRRERFESQAHDLQFTGDAVMSWHWRVAYALETAAISAYHAANANSSPPDYSDLDDIYRIRH